MKFVNQIKGYEEIEDGYFVTTCGKLFSNKSTLKEIGSKNTAGYINTKIKTKTGNSKTLQRNILVGKAFVKGYKNGLKLNHKDHVKTNDCSLNLEWISQSENVRKWTIERKKSLEYLLYMKKELEEKLFSINSQIVLFGNDKILQVNI